MRQRRVKISSRAAEDITSIHRYIAKAAGVAVADTYTRRLQNFISGFDLASERGTLRSDLRPNLRIVGFEKRITIAFKVKADRVEILRFFWGGQNWEEEF